MITTRDELRELRARAAWAADGNDIAFQKPVAWTDEEWHAMPVEERGMCCGEWNRDKYRKQAEATMKAEEAAGIASVPLEATEEMIQHALGHVIGEHGRSLQIEDDRRTINAANAAGNLLTKTEK